ncbi:MAG: hypothetical protein ACKV0T_23720 [Planctomycetales bacterium]
MCVSRSMNFIHRFLSRGRLLAACSALLVVCGSGVQGGFVSEVATPFAGQISETWESFPSYEIDPDLGPTYLSSPTSIMGGNAQAENPVMLVYEPGADRKFGLYKNGSAQTSGAKGMGVDGTGVTKINFSTPIERFGAIWGASSEGGPVTVSVLFFNMFQSLIGSQTFVYDHTALADGGLDWHGWESTRAFSSVEITADFLVIDDLQADFATVLIPEPAAWPFWLLCACGCILALGRRRYVMAR